MEPIAPHSSESFASFHWCDEKQGHQGTIVFDGTWVTIDRSKPFPCLDDCRKGEKKIALTQITSVRWKPPSHLIRGYISFSLAGCMETPPRFGSQTIDAAKDENPVVVG